MQTVVRTINDPLVITKQKDLGDPEFLTSNLNKQRSLMDVVRCLNECVREMNENHSSRIVTRDKLLVQVMLGTGGCFFLIILMKFI
jgi:hypothetical protein